MKMIKCDICDFTLTMQPGGQFAVCENCGTKYPLNRLREIMGMSERKGSTINTDDFEIVAGTLVKYHGSKTNIVVPNNVKKIGRECFKNMEYITSITLPDGLKEIGQYAFYGCRRIESISIPKGVEIIHSFAFSSCKQLKNINLPLGLKKIDWQSFSQCESLTTIQFPDSIIDIPVGCFEDCKSLTEIKLPKSIKSISYSAFKNCRNLKKISIPDSIEEIYEGCFSICPRLEIISASPAIIDKLISLSSNNRTNPFIPYYDEGSNSKEEIENVSPWYTKHLPEIQKRGRKKRNVCLHCGGRFKKTLFGVKCEKCGHPLDYTLS